MTLTLQFPVCASRRIEAVTLRTCRCDPDHASRPSETGTCTDQSVGAGVIARWASGGECHPPGADPLARAPPPRTVSIKKVSAASPSGFGPVCPGIAEEDAAEIVIIRRRRVAFSASPITTGKTLWPERPNLYRES